MIIIQANDNQLEIIKTITISTIKLIYPLYYPKGAVDFFISHHNDESISKDIQSGYVFLSFNNDKNAVGTITIKKNEICRLFILPQYQKQGFGNKLLDFAENKISKYYTTSILDTSIPAKSIYLKRGYIETKTHSIQTKFGDFLCYDVMQKKLSSSINLRK